ncbi:MAG: coproporphyrinogen III oxidase family protein [bacterium]
MVYDVLYSIANEIIRLEGRKFLLLKKASKPDFLNSSKLGQTPALYIHIPFCKVLCSYCSFNRFQFEEEKARSYFSHLLREIDMYLDRGFRFSNVYIGGGTPTVLLDEIAWLVRHLHKRLNIESISLETNPGDITDESIRVLKDLGVRRLSMGVQSFNDNLLKAMGRLSHTGVEARSKAELAQDKFDTFNIDMLYNFPSQTLKIFRNDIEVVKELVVDQVTFYPLMPARLIKGRIRKNVGNIDRGRERAFFYMIVDEFYGDGYRPSTVWCFSRGDRMIDEYIIDYDDYIGVGSGSVGLYNGHFYVNTFSLGRYNEMIECGELPIVMLRHLSRKEEMRYHLLTGLFGMGIYGKRRYPGGFYDLLGEMGGEVGLLKALGIIESDGDGIRVRKRGMFFISVMMKEFFTALNDLRWYCRDRDF